MITLHLLHLPLLPQMASILIPASFKISRRLFLLPLNSISLFRLGIVILISNSSLFTKDKTI